MEKLDFGQAKPEVADAAAGQGWLPVARPVLQQELPNVLPALLTPTSKAAQVTCLHHCIIDRAGIYV